MTGVVQHHQYKSPPIEEALCDIAFEPSQPWNSTVQGRFYERVRAHYSGPIEEQQQQELQFNIGKDGLQQATTRATTTRTLFHNDSRSELVSVRQDGIGIHSLRPYQGWHQFRSRILRDLDAFKEVALPAAVRRVGIRYINRIAFQEQPIDLHKYFACAPQHHPLHHAMTLSFMFRTVSRVSRQGVTADIAISLVDAPSTGMRDLPNVIVLDIDAYSHWNKTALPLDELSSVIDILRGIEREAFEGSITPRAREMFDAE